MLLGYSKSFKINDKDINLDNNGVLSNGYVVYKITNFKDGQKLTLMI
ncbi:hypothetical protein HGG64_03160 [Mycoplasma phocoeninasale]|uniref:Uncharacterized protein n=1 Tax=Mycoplasma phocoeninasale TaxID=2726117 RepID=A0A858U5Y3_9MOLU|nr:hypothetical protein [Mycoplasma phocoeninasale]QJG66675.1 hypothetical protein HGG64_03160 [Mycoplasma phocoeninasale]